MPQNKLHLEKHFTIQDIATLWGMSEKTVRGLFADHPDVMKLGEESRYEGKTPVRGYVTLFVPESAMIEVHQARRSRRSRARTRKQAA
jgi:AraC-like DNA-binding protein